jgi:hypothetical protein
MGTKLEEERKQEKKKKKNERNPTDYTTSFTDDITGFTSFIDRKEPV